jgi:glycosyltransferase involved in cell wall biosynthesis
MHVAYVTEYDARDARQWSGLGRSIARTLELAGCELTYVTVRPTPLAARMHARLRTKFRRRRLAEREPQLARLRARQITEAVGDSADVIFSPGTLSIALLETSTPVVFWTDATFGGMVDFHPGFTNLDARSLRNGFELESSALRRATAAIYSSEWAAKTAVDRHGATPEKLHVMPFGANVDDLPGDHEVRSLIHARPNDRLRLLFVAADFTRKRGDVAVETARLLNARRIVTELTVVGRAPGDLPGFVRSVGYVDKRIDGDRFKRHLGESHFLILPTTADCSPVVISEASAFGVPSFSANVGGVASHLRDGVNGHLLDAGAGPPEYADSIEAALASYDALAGSALEEYHARLSWARSAKSLRSLLDRVVAR